MQDLKKEHEVVKDQCCVKGAGFAEEAGIGEGGGCDPEKEQGM